MSGLDGGRFVGVVGVCDDYMGNQVFGLIRTQLENTLFTDGQF